MRHQTSRWARLFGSGAMLLRKKTAQVGRSKGEVPRYNGITTNTGGGDGDGLRKGDLADGIHPGERHPEASPAGTEGRLAVATREAPGKDAIKTTNYHKGLSQ